MKRLINEIIARKIAHKLQEEESQKRRAHGAALLSDLSKQIKEWMAPLIETKDFVIEGEFCFRNVYSLSLPEGVLGIDLLATETDDILMEFSLLSSPFGSKGVLTLRQIGSSGSTPVFGVVGYTILTDDTHTSEELVKLGKILEFSEEVFEGYLLIVIDRFLAPSLATKERSRACKG